MNFGVAVKQFHQTRRSPRRNLLKMKRTNLTTCHLPLPVSSHPAVQRRGGTSVAALLAAAGTYGWAEHNVGQLRAEEGHVHGRVTVLVLHVDVGALVHQQLHQLCVALRHRQLKRRLVPVVSDVDVTASL